MQKLFLVLVAVAAVSAVGAAGTSVEFVLDSSDAGAEHLLSTDPNTSICSATAPNKCYNGPAELASISLPAAGPFPGGPVPSHTRGHSALGPTGVSHGAALPMPGYTGTMESKLTHMQGARTFRCNFSNGAFLGCQGGVGTFPAEGGLFAHTCASYTLGTTTPGGSGTYRCTLTHNPLL